jgi:hypothetical protein
MHKKLVRATAVGALAVALALVASACGGNGDSDGVASLTSTGQTSTNGSDESGGASPKERREAELAFARCMRKHGVDMPDPTNGRFELRATPGTRNKVDEAQEACRGILEKVAPKLSPEQQAKNRQAMLDFAKCMREHGVDMPDPKFDEHGGMTQLMPEKAAVDKEKFQEAEKACQPILDAARPERSAGEGEGS